MSWNELERLVGDADVDSELQRMMDRCQSQDELIAVATSLGYDITRLDLLIALKEHGDPDMPSVSGG